MKLGIIGCGAIGGQLARALQDSKTGVRLAALVDAKPEKASQLAKRLSPSPRPTDLITAVKTCDLLIEAAGIRAFPDIAREVLRHKKNLLVLSVGALVEQPAWLEKFRKRGCQLHFPSGAVVGLDGLKAAGAMGAITRVRLCTRKPPKGLAGAPYFQQKNIDPNKLAQATRIFSGTARQAIRLFPANVNVAASVSLLGIGPDRTRVEIIADPSARRNSHTLEVAGSFGRFIATTENLPSPENPRTSYLAAASALACLMAIVRGDRRGT